MVACRDFLPGQEVQPAAWLLEGVPRITWYLLPCLPNLPSDTVPQKFIFVDAFAVPEL